MTTDARNDQVLRCPSCSRCQEPMGRCVSCNRFLPTTASPREPKACMTCTLCDCAEVGCFGRKKHERRHLIRSHGEMVAAMSNVSHVNATLLDRVSSAEEKARELENKFAHMEMEVARKEGLCRSTEATVESCRKENAKLREELYMLRQQKDDVTEENNRMKHSIQELKELSFNAQAELSNVRAALGKTSNCLETTSRNRDVLSSEKQSLVSQISRIQHELEVALKKKHELSDIVDNHADEREKLEAELKKLRTSLAEVIDEKDRNEKEARCNTNFLQRELCKLAERFKRRQRLIERLTADKENLMDSLRQRTSMFDTMHTSCHRHVGSQCGVPETCGQIKVSTCDENLNTKILDLQLQLDRKEGLIRALEDRVLQHEPDFSINTDEETFLYRDDLRGDHSPTTSRPAKVPSTSTPLRNFHLQAPDKASLKDSFVDSGMDSVKMKLEDISTSPVMSLPTKNTRGKS
ncbi:centromere protein F-like [Liolophura sinensis]|uniref:centromere protein F-like n=1 Tax=Liolophura sinensis TaxID=3198878 RepID=UPI00315930AC